MRPGDQAIVIGTLLLVTVIFAVVNALVKPVVQVLGCAFYILTLGLFALVVNIQFGDDSSFFGVQDLTNLIELVILGCIPGTYGQNRFGSEPKG